MNKFNINSSQKNIMQRVAAMDLEKPTLIGRIASIRMYELLYILEMEFEKYYKFYDPRLLLQGIYVTNVLRYFLEEKEILYLVHGNVYYYICIKDGHYVGIVDGSSITEIQQNDILETLLDLF